MKKRLYAAYGSNLNKAQMKARCPTAKLRGTGVIHDYELQFKGQSHGAYATIAPKKGASVPVAVWELKLSDEFSLDRYEGYPTHYFKENVPVDMDGETVETMAYIMNLRMGFGLPHEYYYDTVRKGYQDCGLDVSVLDEAVSSSAQRFYSDYSAYGAQQSLFDRRYRTAVPEAEDYEDEYQEDDAEAFSDDDPDESDPFYCPGMM